MRTHSLWLLAALAGLALAACSTQSTPRYETANLATRNSDATLSSHRIRNWSAVDDHTLVFESTDGTRYKAETVGPCFGLDFAQRLGFSNRGGFNQVDRFTSVVLPDGTRCQFQSFGQVVSPTTQALDSFEKLNTQGTKSEDKSP